MAQPWIAAALAIRAPGRGRTLESSGRVRRACAALRLAVAERTVRAGRRLGVPPPPRTRATAGGCGVVGGAGAVGAGGAAVGLVGPLPRRPRGGGGVGGPAFRVWLVGPPLLLSPRAPLPYERAPWAAVGSPRSSCPAATVPRVR